MSWRFVTIVIMALAGTLTSGVGGSKARDLASPWYRGQSIVCVNNRFLDLSYAPELHEGQVYTIEDVLPPWRGFVGLAVIETAAKDKFLAFDERRFLPLKIVASLH